MKIFHINSNYIYSSLHNELVNKLKLLEIENTIFVPVYDKEHGLSFDDDDINVEKCFSKWDRLSFFKKQKKIIKSAEQKFNGLKQVDIIHAYTLFTDGNCAMNLSKKYGIPYVVAVRNTDINVFFKYMIHLRKKGIEILKNASAVFFLSQPYRDIVIKKYVPQKLRTAILDKTYIIPNGINDFWFEHMFYRDSERIWEKIVGEKTIRVVYAGEIDKNKNINLTVDALKRMRIEGWKVYFNAIGKVKEEKVLKKCQKYDFFHHFDAIPKESLIEYYREADVFVMPSHRETFGLVYAEAMSQGLPVIYTRGQGFDKQFEDGMVGYSVDANNPDELKKLLELVLDRYKEVSTNALKYVEKFRWLQIAKMYKNIYIHLTEHEKPIKEVKY